MSLKQNKISTRVKAPDDPQWPTAKNRPKNIKNLKIRFYSGPRVFLGALNDF